MKITNNKKLTQTRRRHIRRLRFAAGLRDIAIYHRAKTLILLAYLVAVIWVWCNREALPFPIPKDGVLGTIFQAVVSFGIIVVGVALLLEIIIALGTPRRASRIQDNLTEAGFTNDLNFPPLLLSAYKGTYEHSRVYEFDQNNIKLSRWDKEQEKIGTALGCFVVGVRQSAKGGRIVLDVVPMRSSLPDKVYWKDEYLPEESYVLALGEGLTGRVTLNLAEMPQVLLGGGTGSGKSLLLKCINMQAIKKKYAVFIADFKGGIDFGPAWHQKCKMVVEPQELLAVLEELTAEMERRRDLFVATGTPNIDEYNKAAGESLPRSILACDEIGEIMDKNGLDKEEKAMFAQIERYLSMIARQGRAFGIHLILATQRPSADLIPGQIRSNLVLRICGRADSILSRIILDRSDAAEQVPLDIPGRFITNTKQVFQGYLFDDNILES